MHAAISDKHMGTKHAVHVNDARAGSHKTGHNVHG